MPTARGHLGKQTRPSVNTHLKLFLCIQLCEVAGEGGMELVEEGDYRPIQSQTIIKAGKLHIHSSPHASCGEDNGQYDRKVVRSNHSWV